MKVIYTVAAFVAVASAQTDLACVNSCIANMLGLGPSLGCASTNITCLCSNVNFGYGVRDCSTASCPPGSDIQPALDFLANNYCLRPYNGNSASAASESLAATSGIVISSGTASMTGSGSGSASGSGMTGVGGSRVPISTEGVYTTITSDGSTITSLASASNTLFGFVTIGTNSDGSMFTSTLTGSAASSAESAASSGGSAASSGSESASSGASSASESASSGASSASESASSAGSSASSEASSAASSASSRASSAASGASSSAASATSSGGAAVMTMAANGVVGLAGLAAVMLL